MLSLNLNGAKEARLPKHIEEQHIDKSLHTCSERRRRMQSEQQLRNTVQSLTILKYTNPSTRRSLRKHCVDVTKEAKRSKYDK